jgi:hypothetical protein
MKENMRHQLASRIARCAVSLALLCGACSHDAAEVPAGTASAVAAPSASSPPTPAPTLAANTASPASPCQPVASSIAAKGVWRKDPKKGLVVEVSLPTPTGGQASYGSTPPQPKNAELVSSQAKGGKWQIRAKPANADYFELLVETKCPAGSRNVRVLVNLLPKPKPGTVQTVEVVDVK